MGASSLQRREQDHPATQPTIRTRTSPGPLSPSWALTWAGLGLGPIPILSFRRWLHVLIGALCLIHSKGCWSKAGEKS